MARMNGIVKMKEVFTSGALRTLSELKPESRPHAFALRATSKQPKANHGAAKTQVHFAAALRHLRHIKNPIKAAHAMLNMISFHTIAAIVWLGIIPRTSV